MSIQISLLDFTDSKAITEFYNLFHPKKGRDEAKFKWEFQNSPYQESIYVIAKDIDTGKIVGSQAAIPLELIDGNGITTLTAKSEDTIVDPAYRGQNIFDNMYKLLLEECSKRGIKVVWGFTTAKKPFTKLEFEAPYTISQSLAVFKFLPSVNYLTEYNPSKGTKAYIKTIGLCLLTKFKSILFSKGKIGLDGVECLITNNQSTQNNSSLIQELLSENKNQFLIKQDANYLKWRLTSNPYHKELVCFSFKKGDTILANISFNHHEKGVWYLIQDIYSKKLNASERASIIKHAISILRKNNQVSLIRTWDFTHNEINNSYILSKKEAGFFHINKGSLFVWKKLDKDVILKATDFILSRIASEGTI